jgi:hypothetical protein
VTGTLLFGNGRTEASANTSLATPKKLTCEHFPGLAIKERKPKLVGTLTQAAEDAGALLGIVRIGAWIAIHEVALERVVNQDGELARGGGNGLGLANARGQSTIKRAESGLRAAQACGGKTQDSGRAIRRGLGARAEKPAARDLVFGRERQATT